ncbi:MAG: DUF6345 domain-containing protein [Dehalococcoidia bacterium]
MKGKLALSLVVALLAATGLLGAPTVHAGDGDYNDETNPSVGAVGLGDYNGDGDYKDAGDLYYAVQSATGFYNYLYDNAGWDSNENFRRFDNAAWEKHLKRHDYDYGGWDILYADDVDICWFQGHSASVWDGFGSYHHALSFIDTTHDDKYLQYWEAKWGDWDLEWMFIHSCKILSDENRGWWARARNGIHLICGAKTMMQDRNDGGNVADYLIDDGLFDWARTVKWSWFHGCDIRQSSAVTLCVIGETHECGDDYIWGQGPVCADPPRDSTYNVWTYYCV